jgi:hypothetical protein
MWSRQSGVKFRRISIFKLIIKIPRKVKAVVLLQDRIPSDVRPFVYAAVYLRW